MWPRSAALAAFRVLLLLLLTHSLLAASSAAAITFLEDASANFTTIPADRSFVSLSLLYPYANTTLFVTSNATALTATVAGAGASSPNITQLPPSQSQSFLPSNQSVLVLPLTIDPSSEYASFASACHNASALLAAGYCNVTLTLYAPPGSVVSYSVHYIPEINFNTVYVSTLAAGAWHYYALWITYAQLDVLFTLTPYAVAGGAAVPDVDLWLGEVSALTSPLVPIFPTDPSGALAYVHTGGQEVVELTAEGGWQDALYVVGVYAPVATRGDSGYTLLLQAGLNDGTRGSSGVAASMFAIVGALVVLVLCLFSAAALIARRRRSYIRDLRAYDTSAAAQTELMHRIQVRALADGRLVTVGMPTVEAYQGASESQIGRLPSHRYAEGEMSADDARCTVCLDDYVAGESSVKVLHCGHAFHSDCIGQWLRTREHCPLCLQNVDNAHDVAKHEQPTPSPAGAQPAAVLTAVSTSTAGEDGARLEVSAALSSTVVDRTSSGRRSSSGQQAAAVANEMPGTPHSGTREERKEQ